MSSFNNAIRIRATQAANEAVTTVKSRSYLYPPLGVVYLATHPPLWSPLFSRLASCLLLSVAIIIPMFFFTYLPQAAVLTVLNGPLGPVNAVALVLSESTFLITNIARAFLLQRVLLDVFDATLISEGAEQLVANGREVKGGSRGNGMKKLGKLVEKPLQRFSFSNLASYFVLLPLNLIPIVGTIAFLVIQGGKTGPGYHSRYFQLKQFSAQERQTFIQQNRGSYTAFGTMVSIMNLVPLLSIIFMFTVNVGAALWAAEIEKGTSSPGQNVDLEGKALEEEKKDEL